MPPNAFYISMKQRMGPTALEKPWSMLTDREKDAHIALLLGWLPCLCSYDHCDLWEPPQRYRYAETLTPYPYFTTDPNTLPILIDALRGQGLEEPFVIRLANMTRNDVRFTGIPHQYYLKFIEATPDQWCEAAIYTLLGKSVFEME